MSSHDDFLQSAILPWAEATDNVRAMGELGSRTHDEPPDEWADMDLLLMVRDRSVILDSDDWIQEIDKPWVALRHPGPFPDLPVRQVLFKEALDFDIVPMTAGTLASRVNDPWVAGLIGGGFRSLVDKDGEFGSIELPPPPAPLSPASITPEEFAFVTRNFLFQIVWAAKHLRRGEIWAAKDDVDCYMRAGMAQVIEWHTVVLRPGTETRSGGRYLEVWADPSIVAELQATFASYDSAGVAKALLASAALFRRVAEKTAEGLGYQYPESAHQAIVGWAESCLQPLLAD